MIIIRPVQYDTLLHCEIVKPIFDLMKTLMQSAQIYKTHHSNRIRIHLNELSTLWLLIIKFQNIIHIKRTFFSVFDNVIESQCLSTEKLFFTKSIFIQYLLVMNLRLIKHAEKEPEGDFMQCM